MHGLGAYSGPTYSHTDRHTDRQALNFIYRLTKGLKAKFDLTKDPRYKSQIIQGSYEWIKFCKYLRVLYSLEFIIFERKTITTNNGRIIRTWNFSFNKRVALLNFADLGWKSLTLSFSLSIWYMHLFFMRNLVIFPV